MPRELNPDFNSMAGKLHTDSHPTKQPEGTLSFALNSISESDRGDRLSKGNEPGNQECYSLSDGFVPVGRINMANNQVAIFSTNGTLSEIGVAEECNYTTLLQSDCLGFSTDYPIKGEFRVINGCERVIYFYDGFNSDKSINIDELEDYLLDGFDINSANTDKWNCNIMKLVPEYNVPDIDLVQVRDSGGILELGSYSFAFAYVDSSFNETDYFPPTRNIPIVDDPYSNGYTQVDGGYSATYSGRDEALGGQSPSSKSIELQFTNVDTSFKFLKPVVIVARSGDGSTVEQFELDLIPISGETVNWIFTGIKSTDAAITLSDVTVNRARYTTSKAMAQVQNRLLRGNLTENVLDWSSFQQQANKITSKYLVKAVLDTRDDVDRHPHSKSPKYYYDNLSYMRDEVYAFGIVWILKDGSESPVFHIPGRAAIDDSGYVATGNANTHNRDQVSSSLWDREELLVIQDSGIPNDTEINHKNVKHLGLGVNDTVERWKIYNTAIADGTWEYNPFWRRTGVMAFFECDTRYPEIRDCNSNLIFPHTVAPDGTVTMDKIRHHKFPDTTLEPHFTTFDENPTELGTGGQYIYPMGIEFDNITPPVGLEDEVQGYRIVRADRTEENKTIFDKGLIESSYLEAYFYNFVTAASAENNLNSQTYYPMLFNFTPDQDTSSQTDFTVQAVWSPKTYFNETSINSGHIKVERILQGGAGLFDNSATNGLQLSGFNLSSSTKTTGRATITSVQDTTERRDTHRQISQSIYKGFLQEEDSASGSEAYETFLQRAAYIDLEDALEPTFVTDIINSDEFTVRWYYIAMKRAVDPYCNLDVLSYIITETNGEDASTSSTIAFGGDCYISRLYYKKVFYQAKKQGIGGTVDATNLAASSIFFWCESEINSSLRNEGLLLGTKTDDGTGITVNQRTYYPKSYDGTIVYTDGSGRELLHDYLLLPYTIPEWKDYNPDFSKVNRERVFAPITSVFDFCSECDGSYPNRITYSEPSLQDIVSDNFRIEKANNFVDMPANHGEITNIFAKDHDVFITTEDMMYKLINSPQQMQLTNGNFTFGTGEFLPVPPVELSSSENGQAGNQGRFNIRVTEYGVFSVDAERGRVYHYTNGLEPISSNGMHHWFQENLPSQWEKQYRELTQAEYPYIDNPYHEFGIGTVTAYDPKHHRVILHKKDFRWNGGDLTTWINANAETTVDSTTAYSADINLIESDTNSTAYAVGRHLLYQITIPEEGLYRFFSTVSSSSIVDGDVTALLYKDSVLMSSNDDVEADELYAFPVIPTTSGTFQQLYCEAGEVLSLYIDVHNASTIEGAGVFANRINYTIDTITYVGEIVPFNITHTWDSADLFEIVETGPSLLFRMEIPQTGRYVWSSTLTTFGGQDASVNERVSIFVNGVRQQDYNALSGTTISLVDPFANDYDNARVLNQGDLVEVRVETTGDVQLQLSEGSLNLINVTAVPLVQFFGEPEFEDLSWTLSYDIKEGGWECWHSYMPHMMYSDSNTFYTGIADNNMWQHVNNNYQTYYGTTYPHMVEFVINGGLAQRLNALQWHSSAYHIDPTTETEIYEESVTYDHALIYNEHQTTSNMLMLPKFDPYEGIDYDPVLKSISRVDDTWKLGQLRDIVADRSLPMFTKDWDDARYQNFYNNGQGYIDKVINDAAVDLDKSMYEQADLKDRWHKVRMMVMGTALEQDYKYILDLASTISMNTKRNG